MFVRATWCNSARSEMVRDQIQQIGFVALEPCVARPDGCLGENSGRFTEMTRGLFDR